MNCFECRDEGVTDFLRHKALDFDVRNAARTYLIIDADLFEQDIIELRAYFTLSMKTLVFGDALSKSVRKRIHGFSNTAVSAESILVGQIGKDSVRGTSVSGAYILELALKRAYTSFDILGGRIALLECQYVDKLIEFYEANNFVQLQTNAESGLLQLVRFL
jgi:hypothetical protein